MAFVYHNALKLMSDAAGAGRIDFLTDTIKAMLVTTAYVADRDHTTVSSAASAELSGTGYVGGFGGSGRKTLASKAFAVDNVNNRFTAAAANPVWTGINAGTAHALIIIKEVTDDTQSLLIAYLDGVVDQPTVGGQLTGTFPGGFCFANNS